MDVPSRTRARTKAPPMVLRNGPNYHQQQLDDALSHHEQGDVSFQQRALRSWHMGDWAPGLAILAVRGRREDESTSGPASYACLGNCYFDVWTENALSRGGTMINHEDVAPPSNGPSFVPANSYRFIRNSEYSKHTGESYPVSSIQPQEHRVAVCRNNE